MTASRIMRASKARLFAMQSPEHAAIIARRGRLYAARSPGRSSAASAVLVAVRPTSRTSRAGRRCRARTTPQNVAAAVAAWRALGIGDDMIAMRPRHLSRPAAPHGAGRRAGRRPVRQRQQGDQPDLDRAGARRFPGGPLDPRRAAPRPTISTPASPISTMSAPPTRSARPGRCSRACSTGKCRSANASMLDEAVQRARRRGGSRARSCCCRRPARRSTSSGTMRRAATLPRRGGGFGMSRGGRQRRSAGRRRQGGAARPLRPQRARPLVLGDRPVLLSSSRS